MASIVLFTKNLYELGTVTAPAAAAFPKERLFDRARGPQWQANTVAQLDLDVNLGAGNILPAAAWGLIHHNLAVSPGIYKSVDGATYTLVDTASVTGQDPFLRTFAADSARYWRTRLPAGATEAQIGELFLGVPLTLSRLPLYGQVREAVMPNVRRDESPGGYAWRVKRGAPRTRLVYGFESLPDADWALLKQAFAECDEGTKSFLFQDLAGTLRWVEWVVGNDGLLATNRASGRHVVELQVQEAL